MFVHPATIWIPAKSKATTHSYLPVSKCHLPKKESVISPYRVAATLFHISSLMLRCLGAPNQAWFLEAEAPQAL